MHAGLSGIISRASNVMIDYRLMNLEMYNALDYNIFISTGGDCLDRYNVRFNECNESSRNIYAII
jgi:NADH:ubiquinone oxidoreductase subunit D